MDTTTPTEPNVKAELYQLLGEAIKSGNHEVADRILADTALFPLPPATVCRVVRALTPENRSKLMRLLAPDARRELRRLLRAKVRTTKGEPT